MSNSVDGGEILFEMRADGSQLQEEIKKTQDALNNLGAQSSDTEKSLGGIAKASKKAQAEVKDIGDASKKTNIDLKSMSGEGISAVAAGLSTVNPKVGALVGLFGQLRVLSGPLAVALGAVSAVVALYQTHQEDLDNQRRISEAVTDALAQSEQRLKAAYEENAVALGVMSDEEAKVLAIRRQSFMENQPRIKALNEELALQRTRFEDAKTALEEFNAEQRDNAQLRDLLNQALQTEGNALSQVEDRRDRLIENMKKAVKFRVQAVEVADAETRATEAQAAADKEAADAARERIAANREGLAAFKAELNAVASESGAVIDRTVADLDKALTEIEQATIRDQEAIGQGISDTLTGVSSLSMTLANQVSEDNKKAAMALFRTSQAAGLADVAINTAVAITKALAQLGPVAGPIAAIGLTATGAAQAAMIAAQPPPAHMGDPLAPDERQVSGRRVLATEAVLDSATTRRMGGEDGLRAMMRNQANTEPVQVNLTYKHLDREVSRLMRSNSRTRRTMRG